MNRLKELRKANRLSISELSRRTGIVRSTLSSIESGKRKMNIDHAKILAPFFGVSIDFILGGDAVSTATDINEALESLFIDLYDDVIAASLAGTLEERSRLIFNLIDRILHDDVPTSDIKSVIAMLEVMKTRRAESDQNEEV